MLAIGARGVDRSGQAGLSSFSLTGSQGLLTQSRSRGTVLSDHGPAIIAVWDEYRRRAGEDAPSGVFRAALRDRCGVDLSRRNGS